MLSLLTPAKPSQMKLLVRDPEMRLSAAEALDHPWLQKDYPGMDEAPFSDSIVQRLQRFGTYGLLKQTVLRTVVTDVVSDSDLMSDLQVPFDLPLLPIVSDLPQRATCKPLCPLNVGLPPLSPPLLMSPLLFALAVHV